jgi:hypothetical protein
MTNIGPEINSVGRRYAELPAEIEVQDPARGRSTGTNPAKQDLLLELCQCFHPYLGCPRELVKDPKFIDMWHLGTLSSDDSALAAPGNPFHESLDSQGCGARSETARDAPGQRQTLDEARCPGGNSLILRVLVPFCSTVGIATQEPETQQYATTMVMRWLIVIGSPRTMQP